MSMTPLGPGPEFDRIRAIAERLGSRAGPLGDDCALVELGTDTLALSTDVSVEGVHFRREWLSPEEIGWRAAAASLSDLAAAGASAIGVLTALTAPVSLPAGGIAALMEGVGAAAAWAGGRVLGGDLSRGDALALALTVVGRVERPMHRRGATPGDGVWVTGDLGGARAAVLAWNAGRTPAAGARARFARPLPRIREGQWLARHGARAMLDVSDGLGGDAGHLAAASGVAVRIDLTSLPLGPEVAAESGRSNEAAAIFAARGGEDYELLVAMPAAFTGTGEFELTRIGSVEAGSGATFLLEGREVRLGGYDHFA